MNTSAVLLDCDVQETVIGGEKKYIKHFMRRSLEKRLFGKTRRRCVNNIKMSLMEICCEIGR